jgi:hypothetical protein
LSDLLLTATIGQVSWRPGGADTVAGNAGVAPE